METIEREKVTVLLLVPAMWNFLLQLPDILKYDVSSVKIGASGGAIVPLSLRKKLIETFPGIEFCDAFGQTEMSPVTAMLKHQDIIRKPGSVGKQIVGVEAKVVNEKGVEVPVGEIGEIIYRGPGMFLEYYNDPQATQEAIKDGWFHSGDLVRKDEEGYIYVIDRKKDMIISGGENVYPAEVEEVLYRHKKVLEVAVIGIPSEKWGEEVHAVVVVKPGEILTEEELTNFCINKLAGYKKPRSVAFVEALPRSASGKVLKTKLREKYSQEVQYRS